MNRSKEKTELLIHTNVELGREVEQWRQEVEMLRENNRQFVAPARPTKSEQGDIGTDETGTNSEQVMEKVHLLDQENRQLRKENETLRYTLNEIQSLLENPSPEEVSEPPPSLVERVARQGKELGNLRKRNQLLLQALAREKLESPSRHHA